MITPTPTRHTIREQIMQQLKARFETAPTVAGDINWGLVSRSALTKSMLVNHAYALGLYDTSERVTEAVGHEMRSFKLVIEFHVRLHEGDEPATFLNHCLGQVQRRVGSDIQMGGLALNARETGSDLDIDGAFDKYVSGVVVFDVSYRCRPNDPYSRV